MISKSTSSLVADLLSLTIRAILSMSGQSILPVGVSSLESTLSSNNTCSEEFESPAVWKNLYYNATALELE